ncbi:D-alanine--D-alanine ligase [Halovulum dunhuangense]|uniref:D-alanine--D-alanine ligase n=1 Tax=Halovulum dunhuangense TaxID=1505036 RepID=A0A849L175_9RHOB|nr:D-alanine--D-alanine ligase [Halovulum dunhuangense]NNU80014.1 D-alanine--D-alanine ligase [Halovulum dunhuangense]
MSSRASIRVAVLKGGPSAEREVSLVSGAACASALRDEGFDVVEIDAGPSLCADLSAAKPDVVFNALHGRWGEDGCVQGMLEWMRLPYTHSGVLASALAMDKIRAKEIFVMAGLPVPEGFLSTADAVRKTHPMEPPYVVKPYNEGSSVGVYIVHEGANGPAQLDAQMPDEVMVERFVPGRELTVSVMGERALTVTDIVTDGWYDYRAKYTAGGSHHVVPADLPEEIFEACLDYAVRAHKALGCRGMSRTDLRWEESRGLNGLFLLETNTQPGMTPTSLAPEQAAHCGISFGQLVSWMVEDATCFR